jgi:benzil reductase ((S)-benzoin forming)
MPLTEKTIFITGVSSGIGNALAHSYLAQGCRVFGISRRIPEDLMGHSRFKFQSVDLGERESVAPALATFLHDIEALDLVILNAGVLGAFGDLREIQLDALKHVLNVNLWANKVVLDCLFSSINSIEQVVTISSGASVNGSRGWAGYAISKTALNMMTMLYARECPQTHFCALAPGLVDSEIQKELASIPRDERFPSLEVIGSKRGTPEMPKPDEAGSMLADIIDRLPDLIESGAYADIRKPPIAELCKSVTRTEE